MITVMGSINPVLQMWVKEEREGERRENIYILLASEKKKEQR